MECVSKRGMEKLPVFSTDEKILLLVLVKAF